MKLTNEQKGAIKSAADYYFGLNDSDNSKTVCMATSYLSTVLKMIIKKQYSDEKVMAEIEFERLKSPQDVIDYIEETY